MYEKRDIQKIMTQKRPFDLPNEYQTIGWLKLSAINSH